MMDRVITFRHQVAIVFSGEIGWTRGLAWDHEHKVLSGCQADRTWNIKTMTFHSVLILDIVKRTVALNTTDGWQCILRVIWYAETHGTPSLVAMVTTSHYSSIDKISSTPAGLFPPPGVDHLLIVWSRRTGGTTCSISSGWSSWADCSWLSIVSIMTVSTTEDCDVSGGVV